MSLACNKIRVLLQGSTEVVNVTCVRFLFVMLWLLGMPALASHAAGLQNVRIIAAEESSFANEVARNLAGYLKGSPFPKVERWPASATQSFEPETLLVIVGESAANQMSSIDIGKSPVLLVASQRVISEWATTKLPASLFLSIQFEQPLPRMMNLASLVEVDGKLGRDQAKVVGVLTSPALDKDIALLESAAAERKLKLRTELVENELAVGPAVARLVEQSSLILALPDPTVHSANTVQPILLLSYRAGVPVIAYSAAYLRAGATFALYSTPAQIARQIAETAVSMRAGKALPVLQTPRYFTVGTNSAVARSMSLELPSTTILEERLRMMKE